MVGQKKVAVLYAGGRKNKCKDQKAYQKWFDQFFEIYMVANTTPIFISGEVTPESTGHLLKAVRTIQREWHNYDAFVVTLPQHRFLYHAALLAFMLGRVGKPVVCTTAPNEKIGESGRYYSDMGFRANLVNAVQAATREFTRTIISFGPVLISALRAIVVVEHGAKKYRSFGDATIGQVDFGIQHIQHDSTEQRQKKPKLQLDHADNCFMVELEGMEHDEAQQLLSTLKKAKKNQGIILDAGNSVQRSLTKYLPAHSTALLFSYEAAYFYQNKRLFQLSSMAPQAAAAKYLWVLGQMKRKGLSKEEKQRSLLEWLQHEQVDEFLKPTKKTQKEKEGDHTKEKTKKKRKVKRKKKS